MTTAVRDLRGLEKRPPKWVCLVKMGCKISIDQQRFLQVKNNQWIHLWQCAPHLAPFSRISPRAYWAQSTGVCDLDSAHTLHPARGPAPPTALVKIIDPG